MRRNNYTALLNNGELIQLCSFAEINVGSFVYYVGFYNAYITACVNIDETTLEPAIVSNKYFRRVTDLSDSVSAMHVTRLQQKCILIDDTDERFICILPNKFNNLD